MSLLAACGAPGRTVQTVDPFAAAPAGENEVRLHVRNLRFHDARLFVVTLGRRRLLGTVTGKRDAAFSIPFDLDQPVHLEIDVLTGPRCTTPTLEVSPGETLELLISDDMERGWSCSSR